MVIVALSIKASVPHERDHGSLFNPKKKKVNKKRDWSGFISWSRRLKETTSDNIGNIISNEARGEFPIYFVMTNGMLGHKIWEDVTIAFLHWWGWLEKGATFMVVVKNKDKWCRSLVEVRPKIGWCFYGVVTDRFWPPPQENLKTSPLQCFKPPKAHQSDSCPFLLLWSECVLKNHG